MYFGIPGAKGEIELMGYGIPTWALYAGVFGVAGGLNESVKDVMKKYTPATAWIYEFSPISTGVAASLTMYVTSLLLGGNWVPRLQDIALPFAVGAVADYSGMLVTDSIIHPISNLKKIESTAKSLLPEAHVLENFNPINFNKPLNEIFLF